MDTLFNLSDGNPAALSVLSQLLLLGTDGILSVNTLTTLNIKGSMIWMLYKDVCREDITKVIFTLTEYTNGKITANALKHAINNRGAGLTI